LVSSIRDNSVSLMQTRQSAGLRIEKWGLPPAPEGRRGPDGSCSRAADLVSDGVGLAAARDPRSLSLPAAKPSLITGTRVSQKAAFRETAPFTPTW
jgi:hypothetical protein